MTKQPTFAGAHVLVTEWVMYVENGPLYARSQFVTDFYDQYGSI